MLAWYCWIFLGISDHTVNVLLCFWITQGDVEYYYIDVWSSLYTWGGGPLPEAGDLVEVPPGQTLLLDMDTPILKVLLIKGKNKN